MSVCIENDNEQAFIEDIIGLPVIEFVEEYSNFYNALLSYH